MTWSNGPGGGGGGIYSRCVGQFRHSLAEVLSPGQVRMLSAVTRAMLPLLLAVAAAAVSAVSAGAPAADLFVQRVGAVCLEGASRSVSQPAAELRTQLAALIAGHTALPTTLQQLWDARLQATQQVLSSQQEASRSLRDGQQRIEQQLTALAERLTPAGCPTGWSRSGRSCFRVSADATAWLTAHASCARLDSRSRLASVNTDTVSLIQSLSSDKLWIGLSRSSATSSWLWADGSPLAYTNWDGGYKQPDNVGGIERCVLISSYKSRGWHDYPCDYTYKYVCQIQL